MKILWFTCTLIACLFGLTSGYSLAHDVDGPAKVVNGKVPCNLKGRFVVHPLLSDCDSNDNNVCPATCINADHGSYQFVVVNRVNEWTSGVKHTYQCQQKNYSSPDCVNSSYVNTGTGPTKDGCPW